MWRKTTFRLTCRCGELDETRVVHNTPSSEESQRVRRQLEQVGIDHATAEGCEYRRSMQKGDKATSISS